MEMVRVERLDHLGLIASVINDLGLVSMIDARLTPDEQEAITPGEAIKGMILNGLGFANRPLSLTPQFFANKPLDLLFRPGVRAEMFNRFKLGRTLDAVNTYGCDLLFSETALAVFLFVWGFFVVADSAQFSALVAQHSRLDHVGTALTVQTSMIAIRPRYPVPRHSRQPTGSSGGKTSSEIITHSVKSVRPNASASSARLRSTPSSSFSRSISRSSRP